MRNGRNLRKINAVNDMHPLGKLIQRIQDENGWTNVQLAERAVARGHKVSKQSIGEYKKASLASISARQANMLADALSVSPMVVIRAAVASMGFQDDVETSKDVEYVVRTSIDLSERDKALILGLLETMRTYEASTDADKPGQSPATHLRAVENEPAQQDPVPEQKIAAFEQGLGEIEPDEIEHTT